MFDLLISILGGLSPRAVAPEPNHPRPFHLLPEPGEIREVTVGPGGEIWVVGEGGLLELPSGRFRTPPPGCPGGFTTVATAPFPVLGGPSGLWILAGSLFLPVRPSEEVLRLAGSPTLSLALTRDGSGRSHLRGCRRPGERWHELYRLNVDGLDLVGDELGGIHLLASDGIRPVSWSGCGAVFPLPEDCLDPSRLAALRQAYLVSDRQGRCWVSHAGAGWQELPVRGRPGRLGGELVVGEETCLRVVEADGGLAEPSRILPGELAAGPLSPLWNGEAGGELAWNSRNLVRATTRGWSPRLRSGQSPRSAGAVRRTEAGALWVVAHGGEVFHRSPEGSWTRLDLPPGLVPEGSASGCDGEALVFASGESLFWLAAPRGREVGSRVQREPRVIDLGDFRGGSIRAVAALGTVLFVALEGKLLRIEGGRVEAWGEAEGVPDAPILALATLFDDLWAVVEGETGPLRFLRGSPGPDRPGDEGPAGTTVCLAADNQSGQLWVGFRDGEKGGAGSISREGVWISQLRLPSAPAGLAAYGGAVVVACGSELILLESGERLRRSLGTDQGLPEASLGALGMVPGEILVDTEVGLYRSLLEVRQTSEVVHGASGGVSSPAFERIEV